MSQVRFLTQTLVPCQEAYNYCITPYRSRSRPDSETSTPPKKDNSKSLGTFCRRNRQLCHKHSAWLWNHWVVYLSSRICSNSENAQLKKAKKFDQEVIYVKLYPTTSTGKVESKSQRSGFRKSRNTAAIQPCDSRPLWLWNSIQSQLSTTVYW